MRVLLNDGNRPVTLLAMILVVVTAIAAGAATREEIAEMAAQRPLVEAAKRIQAAVDGGASSGYAGIVLENGGVALFWKGPVPSHVLAAVEAAQSIAPVRIGEARHSRADLRAAAARVRRQFGRAAVHAIKDPGDGSRLILAVPPREASAGASVLSAVPDLGVAAEVVAEEELRPISRDNDAPPWKGGATIINASIGAGCTSGFGVIAAGRAAILTAGHCATANGQTINDGSGELIGNATQKTGHDQMIVPTSSTTNLIYVGPRSSNTTKTVTRWEQCFIGELLCQSGVTTAQAIGSELCRIRVDSFNTDSESLVEATQIDGQTGARPGDSGGPLYSDLGSTVIAKGTMTRVAGSRVGFQDIPTANTDFGGIQIPGGSATPTPTPAPTGIVTLYQHCDYTGWAQSFNVGNFDVGSFPNDDASSIRVTSGYSATLYADGGFTGTAITLTGDEPCLVNRSFNDVLSSMRVQSGSATATPTATPTSAPSGTPAPTATATPTSGGGTWAPNTFYAVGATVTYGGLSYRCVQAHTSQVGWEPPNAPALWQRL